MNIEYHFKRKNLEKHIINQVLQLSDIELARLYQNIDSHCDCYTNGKKFIVISKKKGKEKKRKKKQPTTPQTIFVDGSSCTMASGVGAVVVNGELEPQVFKHSLTTKNNSFLAELHAIHYAATMANTKATIYSDCRAAIEYMTQQRKIKPKYQSVVSSCRQLVNEKQLSVKQANKQHIHISIAHQLANEARKMKVA